MADKGVAASTRADHQPAEKTEKVKFPSLIERAKEVFHHKKSPRHHKETHGTSDDIDELTSPDEVKAPNVFERVKEEVEAIVEAIHHKNDSKDSKDHK